MRGRPALGLTPEQLKQRAVDRAAKWNKDHPEQRKQIRQASDNRHRSECITANRNYRQTPEGRLVAKKTRLKAFNMTVEQYDWMLAAQGGVCAVCKRPETYKNKSGRIPRLAVDHDHSCCSGPSSCGDCVRALLCRACNSALGFLAESTDRMRQMAHYVESFRPTQGNK